MFGLIYRALAYCRCDRFSAGGGRAPRRKFLRGHTACGAVKGAIDNAELGILTRLLAKIKPAVQATNYKGERSAKNDAFVDAVARKNVEITVADIRKDSAVLAEPESRGTIKIAGAMYDLKTDAVEFFG